MTQGTGNVRIDGFTIRMTTKNAGSNEAGIRLNPGCTDIHIENTIFENITDGSGVGDTIGDETYAIMVWGRDDLVGGQSTILIEDNLIRNVEEYGIALNDNTSQVTITGNKIIDLIGYSPGWPGWPN